MYRKLLEDFSGRLHFLERLALHDQYGVCRVDDLGHASPRNPLQKSATEERRVLEDIFSTEPVYIHFVVM